MQITQWKSLMAGLVLAAALPVSAQEHGAEMPMADQQIYGNQLMTPGERNTYRERMQNATTAEERERIRSEHHEQMVERAQQQGITLPDQAPPRAGSGPGNGRGSGSGMGSGDGMGPGSGMGGMGSGGRRN